jgi:hypothetical protein
MAEIEAREAARNAPCVATAFGARCRVHGKLVGAAKVVSGSGVRFETKTRIRDDALVAQTRIANGRPLPRTALPSAHRSSLLEIEARPEGRVVCWCPRGHDIEVSFDELRAATAAYRRGDLRTGKLLV